MKKHCFTAQTKACYIFFLYSLFCMSRSGRNSIFLALLLASLATTIAIWPLYSDAQGTSSSSSSSVSSSGLQISITDGKSTIRPGDSAIYVITLRNTTISTRTVDVELFLPDQATLISPDQGGEILDKRVRWRNMALTPNQDYRLGVQVGVNPNAPEGYQFVSRIVAGGVEASDATTVQRTPASAASYTISVTDGHTVAAPNEQLSYAIAVTNNGLTQQITDVNLTVSPFFSVDSLSPNTANDSTNIVWKNVTLDPGSPKIFTVNGTVRRSAPEFASLVTDVKVGTSTASDVTSVQTPGGSTRVSSSSHSSQRMSSAASSVRSRAANRSVLFSKTADKQETLVGGSIRYTLYVQNVLLNTIDDAVVNDRFDVAYLALGDAGGATVIGTGQLEWKLPRLMPGEVWTQSYTLNVVNNPPNGMQLSNIASITGTDVAYAALDEKVMVVQTGVVGQLPATGSASDVLFVLMSVMTSGGLVLAQRRVSSI